MQKPRMWWAGDEFGWVVDVEQPLTVSELQRSIEFTIKVQTDRYSCLLPGERKDECLRTIQALAQNKVSQNIIGLGDKRLYDAYKSEGKHIFIP